MNQSKVIPLRVLMNSLLITALLVAMFPVGELK